MLRVPVTPRPGWERTVAEQGLVFELTVNERTGETTHYWNESACYEFTLPEVLALEKVTEDLHRMSVEAARFLAEECRRPGSRWNLGIPAAAVEYAAHSLARGDADVYSRFDFAYAGPQHGPAKMLEYNADTPTGLVEAAIIQWYWFVDTCQRHGYDQWNSLHESLVERWRGLFADRPEALLHFAHTDRDTTGEDLMTVTYLRDTATQAGITTIGVEMSQIGHDEATDRFVDSINRYITDIYKLYPWEDMMFEPFGEYICRSRPTGWFEPPWKMFLSNKALSAALWHLYPGHENLLPTYLGETGGLTEWVKKPLHGREGDNIEIHAGDFSQCNLGPYGVEGHVYQQWCPLPNFPGPDGRPNHPVLGPWLVAGECCGVGIRESDSYVTDYYCRFVPNRIAP